MDNRVIFQVKYMQSIRIKGLKSLVDTGYIEIKPLTVLLGENSSGKSTFLRTFPLFRQSLSSITRGPILWFGSFVDFGSYENVLSKFSETNSISFGFKTQILHNLKNQHSYLSRMFRGLQGDYELEFKIKGDSKNKNAEITQLNIIKSDLNCNIEFNKNSKLESLSINGHSFSNDFENCFIQRDNGKSALLPTFDFKLNDKQYNSYYRYNMPPNYINDDIIEKLEGEVRKYCHAKSNPRLIIYKLVNVEVIGDDFYNSLSKVSNTATWKKRIALIKDNKKELDYIRALIFAFKLPTLLYVLNENLDSYFSNVKYIAPLRATAERYYRAQDLSVDEVDYQGKNLAMFLNNLTDRQKELYKSWLFDNFGFQLEAISEGGHLSLKLCYKNSDNYYNVTDMGFGFSQILPIITQLWFSICEKPNSNDRHLISPNSNVIIIEQPELHLHPRFQSRLVDVFVKAIILSKENDTELQLVIETHSETIINQIGHRIFQKKFTADDVSIVIFDKPSPDTATSVTKANFDEDGNLESWPWGFFEAELD
jgi:predicted ATPase